jgi:uncharacterized protein (DUF1330 family)
MAAYIVFTRIRTRDAGQLGLYLKQAAGFLAGDSMKWLARFGACEVKEGPGIESVGILEFPTVQEARAWYGSPGYQQACQHRFMGADYSTVIVEGLSPDARP